MQNKRSLLTLGDFIDFYYKIREKGYDVIFSKLKLSNRARTISKWNSENSASAFWIIPAVLKRWNKKCTGDENLEYEDYVVSKYLSDQQNIKMLSIGCGSGLRERKFGKYSNFSKIDGIDMAPKRIEEARQLAKDQNINNLNYIIGDFTKKPFEKEHYDVVLFHSSLHHFKNIEEILQSIVIPTLKKEGLLVIFEYVGPRNLQWTNLQLKHANNLLKELPDKYKKRLDNRSIKNRIYRPGLMRMKIVDPSEAVESDSIIPSIHKHLHIIEEKKMGWDLTHLLFKDIAHNFLNGDVETQRIIENIFKKEDEYMSLTGRCDAIFGIYQKAN